MRYMKASPGSDIEMVKTTDERGEIQKRVVEISAAQVEDLVLTFAQKFKPGGQVDSRAFVDHIEADYDEEGGYRVTFERTEWEETDDSTSSIEVEDLPSEQALASGEVE